MNKRKKVFDKGNKELVQAIKLATTPKLNPEVKGKGKAIKFAESYLIL